MNDLQSNIKIVENYKANGVVYTPKKLADFVAKKLISYFEKTENNERILKILDPSIGDGILIFSTLDNLELADFEKVEVLAFDIDDSNFEIIKEIISNKYKNVSINLMKQDFLDYYVKRNKDENFDLIIANPPYIRTQVLGSDKSKELSKIFDIKGKVDIYYIFMMALSNLLSINGSMATITSNRFLSVKSGKVIRDYLLENLNIKELYDLGDTKLFEGIAVLPALVFSKNKNLSYKKDPIFKTIYEGANKNSIESISLDSIYDILDSEVNENFLINEKSYNLQVGILDIDNSISDVWTVSNDETKKWISTVRENTWRNFKDVSKARVGVKSTADDIFIRTDWESLENPPEILHELITSQYSNPFHEKTPKKHKKIIYPHISVNGKASVVNLDDYPNAKLYFEKYKERLSDRKYLIDAGREWYTLWVHHNPELWKEPKIVWNDISEKPKFWMDLEGRIVNGECYWMTLSKDDNLDILWLCLAIANSTFIEKYYDYRFNNKLYSGKRRFITQYVEKFPLPNPDNIISKRLVEIAKEIALSPSKNSELLIDEVNRLVFEVFGVT